jgi:predicted amidohydrolase
MRALLQGTFRSGVAAVFGIAERAGPAFHITQVFGPGGRLGGVYRKRHLAEGEGDYSTGEGAEGVRELRWWSAHELRSSATVTTPRSLPELLDRIAAGDPPDGDEDLGV